MGIIKKLFFILLLSILMLPDVYAQKKYSSAEIKADLDFMVKTMERRHVKLYFHLSKEEFQKELGEIKNSIKDSLTGFEVWKLTAPLIAKLGDGHTSLNFPNYMMNRYQSIDNQAFPFKVKIDGEKLFVEYNYTGDVSIGPGSEILAINNFTQVNIINEMIKYESGEKESFRKILVSSGFGLFLWSLFDMGKEFRIKYISQSDKREYEKVFPGIIYSKYALNNSTAQVQPAIYSLKLLGNETVALIDFRSFSNLDKFKVFLKETFKTIKDKSIKDLIIDIRKNGGGNSILGDELFDYITDKPYRQWDKIEVKSGDSLKTMFGGSGVEVFNSGLHVPRNPENKFSGNSYLLTSNNTFSSADAFSSAFKCFKMGTIIGEETGGVTVSYGDILYFTSPHAVLRFNVSYKHFYEACGKEDGKGVLPDFEVKQSPADTEKGIDTAMEFTLSLIKKSK